MKDYTEINRRVDRLHKALKEANGDPKKIKELMDNHLNKEKKQ